MLKAQETLEGGFATDRYAGAGHMDLEHKAMERLRAASEMSLRLYKLPLVITYSGGKDSDCLLKLAQNSRVPFEVLHSLTTADAPQTVNHVKATFRRLELEGIKCTTDKHVQPDGSRVTMWNLIPRKLMPPTRLVRYCCSVLKEGGGKDRFIATGVRWDESTARKQNRGALEVIASKRTNSLILTNDNTEDRRLFESCQLKGKRVVNPIIDCQFPARRIPLSDPWCRRSRPGLCCSRWCLRCLRDRRRTSPPQESPQRRCSHHWCCWYYRTV